MTMGLREYRLWNGLRRMRERAWRRLALFPNVPVTKSPRAQWVGSQYGGWAVEPQRIPNGAIVYSAGIGFDISFDLALIERYNAKVFAFDPTPPVIQWLDGQWLPEQFVFVPVAIGGSRRRALLWPPQDPNHVSHSAIPAEGRPPVEVEMHTVSALMADFGHTELDVLKLDIEGAEYEAVPELLESGVRPTQLLLETHFRRGPWGTADAEELLASILDCGYRMVYHGAAGDTYSFVLDAQTQGCRECAAR